MSDVKLTVNNDVDASFSDYQLIEGTEAVAQHLKLRLQSERLIGIFRGNLDKNVPEALVRLRFRNIIVETPGVESLVSYEFSVSNRVATINAQIVIDGGQQFFFTFSTDEVLG